MSRRMNPRLLQNVFLMVVECLFHFLLELEGKVLLVF